MKLKMLEFFQGSEVHAVLVRTGSTVNILEPGEVYEVDRTLGSYLLDNRKAEEVKTAGKGVADHDNEPQFENVYPEPVAEDEPKPKTKRGKK